MKHTKSVSKLTTTRLRRQEFDTIWRSLKLSGLVALASNPALANSDWHPVDDIAQTAERHLAERLADDKATIRARMIDERLRLSVCDKPLETFMRPGTRIAAKTIVGVRCPGSKPWKIYVPVEVVVRTQVWVARRSMPRGHLLVKADLIAEERDVSRMKNGYVTDLKSLLGQRLKSSILAGRAITEQLVQANDVVSRGQTVTLAVTSGGINIRMMGKALTDGAVNERIRVENLNSGRVVEGVIRSPEIVEVLVSQTGNFFNQRP